MARTLVESSSSSQAPSGPSENQSATTGIMIIIVFCICIILKFTLRLFLATKYNQRLRRLASATASSEPKLGLSPEEISLLPRFVYQPSTKGDREDEPNSSGLNCAVCINDLVEGEMVRVLPTCEHFFHVECIDRWLCKHSSCPMCRARPEPEKVKLGIVSASSPLPQLKLCATEDEMGQLGSPFENSPRATNLHEIRIEVQSLEEMPICECS